MVEQIHFSSSKEVVKKYFGDLEATLNELNLMNQPNKIWTCDETGFNFENVPGRVVAEKGDRAVTSKIERWCGCRIHVLFNIMSKYLCCHQ